MLCFRSGVYKYCGFNMWSSRSPYTGLSTMSSIKKGLPGRVDAKNIPGPEPALQYCWCAACGGSIKHRLKIQERKVVSVLNMQVFHCYRVLLVELS